MNQKREKMNANPVGVAPLDDQSSKGITLIALIITIIIMLILVGVTVSVAINGGLFSTAKQAKADTQANIEAEQRLASGRIKVDDKWYNSLEDYTKGIESSDQNDEPSKWAQDADGNITYDGKQSGIKIGDYVNYTPNEGTYSKEKLTEDYTGSTDNGENLTTDTNLNWRVLGVDTQGCLTLISDKPTTKTVYFKGAKGYNNGVYILNDICAKLYSNTKLGVTARSLTIEDIEAGFSDTGITERNEYSNSVQYGKTKTYTSNLNYPVIYAEENGSGIGVTSDKAEFSVKTDGIGESDPFYKTEQELTTKAESSKKAGDNAGEQKALTCKQTYYSFSSTPKNYCKNEKFHEMIFGSSPDYWLASRFVYCIAGFTDFGLRSVRIAYLYGRTLFRSDATTYGSGNSLRLVVSLRSDISIELVSDSSVDNPHKIVGLE